VEDVGLDIGDLDDACAVCCGVEGLILDWEVDAVSALALGAESCESSIA
jgi:hypothetical protein